MHTHDFTLPFDLYRSTPEHESRTDKRKAEAEAQCELQSRQATSMAVRALPQ